ncbi:hypothetical protein HYU18_04615 [Candidatus Woesearchaeota archaeon]|nr:hypothetical protein [Candidatus Woesearchaeota archaeon]
MTRHASSILLAAVTLLLIAGCTLKQPATNELPEETGTKDLPAEKKIPVETQAATPDSNILPVHPTPCKPVHGFDNYRTEQAFAINPKNNKEMYLSVEYKGLFKSSDGGNSWMLLENGLEAWPKEENPNLPCYMLHFSIHIDPSNPERILFPGGAAPGMISELMHKTGGLHESLDGGKSWHQLFKEDMGAYTGHVATDPRNSSTIYVDTTSMPASHTGADPNKLFVTKGIVYKTTDGGKTWIELPTGIVKDMRSTGLFIDQANPENLIMTVMALPSGTNPGKKLSEEQPGMLITNNGGKSWTKSGLEDFAVRFADVSQANFRHIFLFGGDVENEKSMYSLDGGLTFSEVKTPVNFARFDPHDKSGMRLLGFSSYTWPDDLFESTDGGKTWNPLHKLPQGVSNEHRPSNIVFDPIDKNAIYINGDLGRVWKSSDKGKTWTLLFSVEKLH